MNQLNNLNSPLVKGKITSKAKKLREISRDYFSSVNGFLSIYTIKSISRTPIIENISIKGVLREDGTIIIYFNGREFFNIHVLKK